MAGLAWLARPSRRIAVIVMDRYLGLGPIDLRLVLAVLKASRTMSRCATRDGDFQMFTPVDVRYRGKRRHKRR
jgi:hypothetical protein